MVRIDGSIGGGSRHAVRTALSLAAAVGAEVEISSLARDATRPGLRGETLGIARALARVTSGRLEGDAESSDVLRFFPGRPQPGRYAVDARDGARAGSAPLLATALLPALARAYRPSEVVVTGVTHGGKGPSATYLQTVLVPTARKFGLHAEVTTTRWGWAPDGDGEIVVRVDPTPEFAAVELTDRGAMLQIGGSAVASGMEYGYAQRLQNRIARRLAEVGRHGLVQVADVHSKAPGAMAFLLAVYERSIAGFTSYSNPTDIAERTADVAVNELFSYLTSYMVLDKHLPDQLLVYAALAKGVSRFSTAELTAHTLMTAEMIRRITPALVSFDGRIGQSAEIEVVGAGGRV